MRCTYKNVRINIAYCNYKPTFSTKMLADSIEIMGNPVVCDVGTGCGVLALLASKLGAKKVFAIDIDRKSGICVQKNSKANKIENVEFLQGSIFMPLKDKVDIIVANLPQTPSNKKIDMHRNGSLDGTKNIMGLLRTAPKKLKKRGFVLFTLFSLSNPSRIFNYLRKHYNFKVISVAERKFVKKKYESLSKGLSSYIIGMAKKGKAMFFCRDNELYYLVYVVKAIPK